MDAGCPLAGGTSCAVSQESTGSIQGFRGEAALRGPRLAHVDLGPSLWRDEAVFEWVQMASGQWYRVDNPAVHWDGPG